MRPRFTVVRSGMVPNDALRKIASLVKADEAKVTEIIRLGGGDATGADVGAYLKDDTVRCPPAVLAQFLNGLVIYKRGPKDQEGPPAVLETSVSNNVILKKVRVAFALKDADVVAIFAKGGARVSKSERAAYFRRADDAHFRPCDDAAMQSFLKGLAL